MKAIISLVFDYDASQWARTHDIDVVDAPDDFAALLRRAVDDGTLSAALDAHWPMMRGHVTAHTVDGLDAATRDELANVLRQARDADQDDALIRQIRQYLGEGGELLPIEPSREIVTYRPDAARRWLAEGAADEFGIDDSFTTEEITIAARLGDLLRSLADDPNPQVWRLCPPVTGVHLWRTADGDGIDGGALVTADLRIGVHDVDLAVAHVAFDEFTDDARTNGIDAAAEALGLIAHRANQAVTGILQATSSPPTSQSAT